MRYAPTTQLEIAPQGGLGTAALPSIGVSPDPVIRVAPAALTGLLVPYALTAPTVLQSTWQTAYARSVFTPTSGLGIGLHLASYANGTALGYEIALAQVTSGSGVRILHAVTLLPGWTIDSGEATAGAGVGRLSLRDPAAVARLRVGTVELIAFGSSMTIADSPTFFGLARLADELEASPRVASAGPPGQVGSNFSGGIHAPLVTTSYSLVQNMAEGALGRVEVTSSSASFTLTLVVPSAFIERNRATSSRIFVGARLSGVAPVDFGTGSPDRPAPAVHGRHLVFFDDEASISGREIDLRLHNVFSTFDGAAPVYSLFPNGGGNAALYDVARQQQTGFGCSGCTVALQGSSRIDFVGGGFGVGIAPGPRVGPADPCLASDPLNLAAQTGRCAAGLNKRASFTAGRLEISGSMSGLVAAESDLTLDEFVFTQAPDRNATDPTLLHTVQGLGCAADAGPRIGINPSNGVVMGNVPFDNACSAAPVGQGTCLPNPLATPATTGLCNLVANQLVLSSSGKSAPTRLEVANSILDLDLDGDGPSSGLNPALPALVLDANLQAVGGGLTIGRRLAGLFRPLVQISLGADAMYDPDLFSLVLSGNTIGVDAAALAIDNFDSRGGILNLQLAGNCYSRDGSTCLGPSGGDALIGSATGAAASTELNTTALSQALSQPNPSAGIVVPEPAAGAALTCGVGLLAWTAAGRRGGACRVIHG